MSSEPRQVDSIFLEAAEISDPAARMALLDHACGDDAALRLRVERLLANAARMGEFLQSPAFSPAEGSRNSESPDVAGQMIGPYKLVQMIGEGGMGVVYLAEQEHPVRRQVAIKAIRVGMDSAGVLARFDQERQALALMDHPNIARVLDAGVTPDGRPFFAMEFVQGIPITRYCDKHQLSIDERIRLFIPVCRAVQHAHQKGIVHRDLKPSNVLVGIYDPGAPGVPKVIDFGVAKAVEQSQFERTRFTEFGQIVGTMEYMAPEQAETDLLDIDTRADIYTLGVLLYELLTGTTPFTARDLRAAGLGQMLHILKDVEPIKPSTKITSAENLPQVAANRRVEPKHLARRIRGDLDWIAMKCLEKARGRRYETALGLAQDLERFLADEPVLACPPSLGYRFLKFARRNRVVVTAGTLLFLALLGGVIGTSIGLVNARRQAELARAAEWRESKARQREKERADAEALERQRAEAAEAEGSAVIDFLLSDLIGQAGSLAQADRKFEPNPNLTIREALDRAAAAVGEKFADRPDIEVAIRTTIGESYLQLGLYEKAIEQLEKATNLSEQRLGDEHPGTLDARDNLAQAYRRAAKFAEAVSLFERISASRTKLLGPDAIATLITRDNLAVAYRDAGRTADALALFEQVRDAKIRTLGPDNPRTLVTLHNLASMYLDAGNLTEAIGSLEQIYATRLKVLGHDHPDTLPSLQNLAVAYWRAKQLEMSIPRFEQLLKLSRKVHGDEHTDTLEAMANLGVNYRDAGRIEEGIAMLEQARRSGANPAKLDWMNRELMIAYERGEQSDKGVALAKEIFAKSRESLPDKSTELASALAVAGSTMLRLKAWSDAEPVLRECLAIREELEPDEWRTFNTKAMLGESLLGQSKFSDAESMLLQGRAGLVERREKIPPGFQPRLRATAERLAALYEACNKPADAEKWRRETSLEPKQ